MPATVKLLGVDLEAMQSWIGSLLEEKAEDMYRMKGILAVDGTDVPCGKPRG